MDTFHLMHAMTSNKWNPVSFSCFLHWTAVFISHVFGGMKLDVIGGCILMPKCDFYLFFFFC